MKIFKLRIIILFTMLISTTYFYGQNVEFTIKFDEASCTYGVYATPDFTNPAFIFAGGSQISIVVPASVDNAILGITTNNYGWADSSQIYAPAADTSSDFHGVSANGGVVSFTSGVELLMFSFELPNSACCAPGVRLFDNATDPQSTDSGMGGGDFNNYFADALLFTDYYNGNYGDSISIPAPTGDAAQAFCTIDNPTVSSLVTNEADVVWYNQSSGGTAYAGTDNLVNGTIYYGALEPGSCVSSSRLAVTVTLNTTAAPTGDATQNFCSQDSPTVGDLVTVEGSTTWYNQASGGTVYNSGDALSDGTIYYGEITANGCVSTSRFAVTANVYSTPAPTGDATQNFCSQDTPTIANLVTNEGSTTWYNQASGGTAYNSGDALSDGTIYYGEITVNGCVSTSRFAVTANVYSTPAPTGFATQEFCTQDNPTIADLITNESNVTWYNQASGGTAYNSGNALSDGTIYYGEITANGCVSTSRLAVTANVGNIPAPTGDAAQAFCTIDSPTVVDIVVNEAGVVWYDQATGGTAYNGTDALVNGETYYGSIESGTCVSTSRLEVTVTLNTTASPTTSNATQDFCIQDNPTIADLSTNEGSVTWYNQASGGTAYTGTDALTDETTYYGEIIQNGCPSTTRLAVAVNIYTTAAPTGNASQDFCSQDSPTIADLVTNEGSTTWYNQSTGGTAYNSGDALSDGTIYYGEITQNGCVSTSRLAVTANVYTTAAPTGDATQNFCSQDSPTVGDLVTVEGSTTWYNQASGGTAYTGTDALTNGTTYYGEITANGCVSASRLAVSVNVYSTAAPTGNASQSFCGYDSPTVASLSANENNVTWYNQASGGTAYASTDALVTSTTYYGEITQNGCVSTSRLAVTVTLTTNCDVTLNIKMMLHGALSGTSDGLMRDDLRTGGHIPEEQPYSSTLNARFTHVNNTGDETTNATVLSANDGTGDAVVDWVFIEIRNPLDDTEVIKTISALVQRDGDVVDAATGGALRISSLPETFYVAVKHRNHFGAMTANPITASMGLATIDFTSLSDANTYHLSTSPDNVAMNDVDMTGYTGKALFAGNANYDNKIKYDGINNDRQTMGSQVLSDSDNTGQVLNFNAEGYLSGDINMDGTVKYDGIGNERQVMQNSVITYPLNTGNLNNYNNMIEQIPQ